MFRKASKPQSRIDSWIGSSTSIEGNLYFSGGMRVDGVIRGNVTSQPDHPGTLVVSENARIDGEVHATHIVVSGTIVGPVHATESLELQAGSRIKGDVYYKTIEMVQGSVVEGRMVHQGDEVKSVELKLATGS